MRFDIDGSNVIRATRKVPIKERVKRCATGRMVSDEEGSWKNVVVRVFKYEGIKCTAVVYGDG